MLGRHLTSVREWSLIVLLTVLLCGRRLRVGAARRLARAGRLPGLGYLLFVWVTWADPQGAFRLVASAYRYVTPPIVLAGLFLPVMAERLAQRWKSASATKPR